MLTAADAQTMQEDALARGVWVVWFVTAADLEHPGKVTARTHTADHQGGVYLPGALVADSLDELRTMLPAGLTQHDRTSLDPPDVIETWE